MTGLNFVPLVAACPAQFGALSAAVTALVVQHNTLLDSFGYG